MAWTHKEGSIAARASIAKGEDSGKATAKSSSDEPVAAPIEFSLLAAVTTALERRPELARSLLAISDAEVQQRLADNAVLPQLDLTARAGRRADDGSPIGDHEHPFVAPVVIGDRIDEAIEELLTIAREADVRAEIYHLKLAGRKNWERFDEGISQIENAPH